MAGYRVVLEHDCDPANIGVTGRGLTEGNESAAGYNDEKSVAVFVQGSEDQIVGGLMGSTYWGWLDSNTLWVRRDLRRRGLGSQLLRAAEQEAVSRDCRQALLDTFGFRSPGFYAKHGYELFGQVDDFVGAHRRWYMRKTLAQLASSSCRSSASRRLGPGSSGQRSHLSPV